MLYVLDVIIAARLVLSIFLRKEKIMGKEVIAGSVLVSSEGTIWYACGDWALRGIENVIPCVPAYVLKSSLPDGLTLEKQITVGRHVYAKIFGYHGLSLAQHREYIFPRMNRIIHQVTVGRVAFLNRKAIEHISDPRQFRELFLDKLEGARATFQRLAEELRISIIDIGISGSVLAIGSPSWRHEIDFSVMGAENCSVAFHMLTENRLNGVFSKQSMPPYHMPFAFEGKWFDPHFSDTSKEKVLNGGSITLGGSLRKVILRITDDSNGIFFPTFYGTEKGKRLLTFRPSHRGLYRNGDRVYFENLGIGVVTYASGLCEEVYLVVNEEWGERI